ncbi:hypothetical protein KCM76_14290 [Zooshikella marina]|uniref:hypothetical protein n=1 Tax=Zooshikella ganghwensis TaxID=202772 RepID=UPI001BB051D3|nr:hypothetical protein [Zooshikella ganghwensis]MBU2707162.1 hypothetical protein [Zooshikella ganghwensis]
MKRIILLCLVYLLSDYCLAGYTLKRNRNLELCREFLAYLNRKPDFYYFEELKQDKKFKSFTLPKLSLVDKSNYLKLYEKIYFYLHKYENLPENKKNKLRDEWYDEKEFILSDKVKLYTANIDANHNGKIDKLLIAVASYTENDKDYSFKGSYYYYWSITKEDDFNPNELYKLHEGLPFYYKGRFYMASMRSVGVSIYEPEVSKYYPYNNGVTSGLSICVFDRKKIGRS